MSLNLIASAAASMARFDSPIDPIANDSPAVDRASRSTPWR